jgi:hypothetical protein
MRLIIYAFKILITPACKRDKACPKSKTHAKMLSHWDSCSIKKD